jgi:hypothetical protein
MRQSKPGQPDSAEKSNITEAKMPDSIEDLPCVSCGKPTPPELYYKYAPVILCEERAKTLDNSSFVYKPDEIKRAGENLGRL